ncbi:PRAME family member 12-like [Ochotona curzoniae]|uniref:PRAME family member 12-like n=1 Tax=Ochotona curzoniae TaxID=130825 RepID=UPI001B349ADA|nr:PRAME family member 12-like [Ochotona curzoniae]
MSSMTPPRLLQLAQKSLLGNEALAILSLDQLPREMFPVLFVEAFNSWLLDILKAMVRVWPFEVLPLGALMKNPQVDILKAVLDGLDMKYTQKSDCRRGKLHVLDLRDDGLNFWNVWAKSMDDACSSEPNMRRQPVEHKGPKSALMVIANVSLTATTPDAFLTHLLQWVKERASLVHLCCHKLKILANLICSMSHMLESLEFGCIEELEVCCDWQPSGLAKFAPYLGRMSSLHKLSLVNLSGSLLVTIEEMMESLFQFASQFAKLPHLRSLHIRSLYFVYNHLDQLLRCLKSPLEDFSVTACLLSEADINYLSQCPCLSEIKYLALRVVKLTHISPEPLRVLLERVAPTLMTLDLMGCEITDSQLNAILPALSHCYQLTSLSFYGNRLSMAMMEKLVEHTGNLSALIYELYPAPLESYDTQGIAHGGRFSHLCTELMGILERIREPKQVLFSTDPCWKCAERMVFGLNHPNQCHCYQLD